MRESILPLDQLLWHKILSLCMNLIKKVANVNEKVIVAYVNGPLSAAIPSIFSTSSESDLSHLFAFKISPPQKRLPLLPSPFSITSSFPSMLTEFMSRSSVRAAFLYAFSTLFCHFSHSAEVIALTIELLSEVLCVGEALRWVNLLNKLLDSLCSFELFSLDKSSCLAEAFWFFNKGIWSSHPLATVPKEKSVRSLLKS